jgi:hypothetical protein
MYIDLSILDKRAGPPAEDPDDWSLYFYDPSLAAAVVFAAVYLLTFFYHLYISYHAYRNDKYFRFSYSVPLLIAALAEVNGYGQRAGSTQAHQDIGLFSTSQTMIVLAPVFVCASLYILLSRIIRAVQPEGIDEKEIRVLNGWIKVIWLPKIFVTLDILSMLTQGGGSGIAASGEWEGTLLDIGIGVLIGGLALQLATFTLFLIVVIKFHSTSNRRGPKLEDGMVKVIHGIYIAGFFIMVRSPLSRAQQAPILITINYPGPVHLPPRRIRLGNRVLHHDQRMAHLRSRSRPHVHRLHGPGLVPPVPMAASEPCRGVEGARMAAEPPDAQPARRCSHEREV